MNDLNLFLEGLSDIFKDKDTLYRIYEVATKEKYSFLCVDYALLLMTCILCFILSSTGN